VFVWKDKESMYAADDYNKDHVRAINGHYKNQRHNFIGQATVNVQITLVKPEGSIRNIPRKFGEIYVVDNMYRSEVASHEIAHIVNYWGESQNWKPYGKDDEKVARLTGRLNSQFWTEHYKVYDNA
jgi:hypothetical protein